MLVSPLTAVVPFGRFRIGGDRNLPFIYFCLTHIKVVDKKEYQKTPFRQYYEEFCEVLGHPLWMMPMMLIGLLLMIELLHTNYHMDAEKDAHGYCGQKEFVKKLQRFYENNAY